jgi:hypothetical protein
MELAYVYDMFIFIKTICFYKREKLLLYKVSSKATIVLPLQ